MKRCGATGGNPADASPSKQSILGVSALGTQRLYGLAELWWVACSVALALGISVATGLIPKWGQWYSVNMAYRRQTEAIAERLARPSTMIREPSATTWRGLLMECNRSGGLGVPSWRLPFELVAKLFGHEGFPDRLALAAAMALLTYALAQTARIVPLPLMSTSHGKRQTGSDCRGIMVDIVPSSV